MKKKEFEPCCRHKRYGLLVEISDDLVSYRFKGLLDEKPSRWRKIKEVSNSFGQTMHVVTIWGEKMFIDYGMDFVSCKTDGNWFYEKDRETYGKEFHL